MDEKLKEAMKHPGTAHLVERPNVERPDWLWEKWPDGTNVYWTQEKVEIRDYIEHLEHNLKVAEKALSEAHTRLEAIYEKYGENCENVRE